MVETPPHAFTRFAHALVDLGADLIHGHNAHIFQGIEIHQGKPILYDTGGFVDDYAVDPLLRNDCADGPTLQGDGHELPSGKREARDPTLIFCHKSYCDRVLLG